MFTFLIIFLVWLLSSFFIFLYFCSLSMYAPLLPLKLLLAYSINSSSLTSLRENCCTATACEPFL